MLAESPFKDKNYAKDWEPRSPQSVSSRLLVSGQQIHRWAIKRLFSSALQLQNPSSIKEIERKENPPGGGMDAQMLVFFLCPHGLVKVFAWTVFAAVRYVIAGAREGPDQ